MKQSLFNLFFGLMFMVGVVTTLAGFTMLLVYLSSISFAIM